MPGNAAAARRPGWPTPLGPARGNCPYRAASRATPSSPGSQADNFRGGDRIAVLPPENASAHGDVIAAQGAERDSAGHRPRERWGVGQRCEGTLVVRAGGVWLWLLQGEPCAAAFSPDSAAPSTTTVSGLRARRKPRSPGESQHHWAAGRASVAPPRRGTNRLKGATAFAPPHSDYFTNRTQTGVGTLSGLPVSFNRPVAWSIANT